MTDAELCPHGFPRDEFCARCDDERIEHEHREWERRYWRRQLLNVEGELLAEKDLINEIPIRD